MRLRYLGALAATSAVFGVFLACSSSDPRPEAAAIDREAGITGDASYKPKDSDSETSTDGGDGGDLGCTNKFKDNLETDTDCGGTACPKCVDGQACIKDSDCAGNACIANVCKTAKCTDGVKNGDETDIDCGGTVCPKCNIGRACNAPTDCRSNSCGNNQCACPENMAIVSRTNGTSYCVDSAEVTKGQYNKFIAATVPITTQPPHCAANTSFVPNGAWPPQATPENIAYSFSIPVHYVDWCDAFAYCKWAGKQLCGTINGGPMSPNDYADAGASAWYNACSAQGTKAWPYGNTFTQGQCNDDGAGDAGSQGNYFGYGGINQDQGTYTVAQADNNGNIQINAGLAIAHPACLGGSVNLYQMSGNVAEWEDSCDGDAGANDKCRLRGGSYTAARNGNQVRCDADRQANRVSDGGVAELADVGFRCCVY